MYSDSIEQVFRRRDAMQMQAEKCQDELQRKTEEIKSVRSDVEEISLCGISSRQYIIVLHCESLCEITMNLWVKLDFVGY